MAKKNLLTEEIKDEICQTVASGHHGLATLAKKNPHWGSYNHIRRTIVNDIEFGKKYDLAKQLQADFLADGVVEIAKDCEPSRPCVDKARLEIDTIKWLVGVLKPRVYAYKVFNGNLDKEGQPTEAERPPLDLSKLSSEELRHFLALQRKAESPIMPYQPVKKTKE